MQKEESEKAALKLNIKKTKTITSSPITSWQILKTGKKWKQWQIFIFLGSKITVDSDCSHEIKRCLLLGKKAMTNLDSVFKSRNIYITYKIASQKELALQCKELKLGALWQPRGVGGRFKREGTYVYLWLIHVDVWQNPTQSCKAIILQLKRNKMF